MEALGVAAHGVVGEDDGEAEVVPYRVYAKLRQVLDYAAGLIALGHGETASIGGAGDYAFYAGLGASDRTRFMEAFGEAVAESIRLEDPRPAEFLVNAYRSGATGAVTSAAFSGEMSPEVEEWLGAKIARR